ncbi:MAG TPA: RnfABCDGE type electron transport complex subunit D [Clostridiales bacterium]|nr:RnfABCDGE type electron transport complex subunit D [Clostridiales bacterium]
MTAKLYVSSSPHLRQGDTTQKIMLNVVIALMPALIAAVVIFGWRVLLVTGVTVGSCVLAEFISRKVMKRKNTVFDLSAVVTGMLLAMNLPVNVNLLIAVFGSVVAIVVVKQMFGGLGQNFVNPAIAARIVLLVSFPAQMTTWTAPLIYQNGADAVSTATPLANNANGISTSYMDLFLGTTGGCLGETCAIALIIGGVYLIVKRIISPIIPLCFIGTVALFAVLVGQDPLFHILSGGVIIGAFFMATDYTTSPITFKGKLIFGISCGVITMLIRLYANLPEGVSFSIILMNILTPLIERGTMPKPFGSVKKNKA